MPATWHGINGVMSGDDATRARFERIYREHLAAVLAYAVRRGAVDTAPDIAAETFLIAWRRIDDIPDDPRPWLLVVARNVMHNQRRGEARYGILTERLRDEERRRDLTAVSVGDDPDLIVALNRIPAADRELLCLEAWDGLTRAQLAATAGCSEAALRVRLHRARRRLTGELDAIRRESDRSETTAGPG